MTTKKNRVEVTFSDAENDLWQFLEKSNLKKATFIKKVLRESMLGNAVMTEQVLDEKIKAAVAEAVGKDPQEKTTRVIEPDVFGGKEF